MKRFIAVGAGVFSLALAGCGGSSHSTTTTTPSPAPSHKVTIQQECPPGHAFMGCSQTGVPAPQFQQKLKTLKAPPKGALKTPSGALFSDVSNWQGAVGWPSVGAWQKSHGWPQGGVFKMGEGGSRDTWASHNATVLGQLHYWKSGYWFVRSMNCTSEANAIISASRDYHVTLVAEDLEVPEARGFGQCLTPKLKAAGLKVTTYTSPGTNPGGVDTGTPLWQATFGSGFNAIWHPVIAWQCTDGTSGCVTNVPGIGFDDVNVDYGYSKLAGSKPPPPPDPYKVLDKTLRHFPHNVTAREYNTVKTWDTSKCANPTKRAVCNYSHYHMTLLAGRVWFVAHHTADLKRVVKTPRWSVNNLGTRFQFMWKRLTKGVKNKKIVLNHIQTIPLGGSIK